MGSPDRNDPQAPAADRPGDGGNDAPGGSTAALLRELARVEDAERRIGHHDPCPERTELEARARRIIAELHENAKGDHPEP